MNRSIKAALDSYFVQHPVSCTAIPLSDGGEGFLDNFLELFREEGKKHFVAEEEVTGPRGAKVLASFIVCDDANTKTAVCTLRLYVRALFYWFFLFYVHLFEILFYSNSCT